MPPCISCKGAGTFNIGDVEEGVFENCPECNGWGEVEDDE